MKPFKNHKIAEIANEKTRIPRPSQFQDDVVPVSEADLARETEGFDLTQGRDLRPSALQPGD